MRKSISIWPVCALLACMLVAFVWSSAQLTGSIKTVDEKYNQSRVRWTELQTEQVELKDMLKLAGTDSFIEHQARTLYGYMRPDEIRLVITNPEVLYGMDGFPVK